MKILFALLIYAVSLARAIGDPPVPWADIFHRLQQKYPTFHQVVQKNGLAPLDDRPVYEVYRLIENYGWGMRVITVTITADSSKTATVVSKQLLPGKSEIAEASLDIDRTKIAPELEVIKKSEAYREQEKVGTPRVIDGETFLVEHKVGQNYTWFFRDCITGSVKAEGIDALEAFSAIELKGNRSGGKLPR